MTLLQAFERINVKTKKSVNLDDDVILELMDEKLVWTPGGKKGEYTFIEGVLIWCLDHTKLDTSMSMTPFGDMDKEGNYSAVSIR